MPTYSFETTISPGDSGQTVWANAVSAALNELGGLLNNGSTSSPGVVELATQTEVNTGTDATRVLTPLTFQTRVSSLLSGKANTVHGHALTDSNITGILPFAQIPTGTTSSTVALGDHTHTSASVTDLTEAVQDIVGAFVVAGANVTVDYNDTSNTLTISAAGGSGGGGSTAWGGITGTLSSQTDLQTALNNRQLVTAALTAFLAATTAGMVTRTGTDTYTTRTITGSTYISVSNGSGAAGNPTISITGAIPVANGGSGRTTATTAYGLIAAGTTATSAQQTIAPGTAGFFLRSGGASALAAFAAIAQSDVTNLVTDLAGKAPTVHTHAQSDVTNLVTDLAGKAATVHGHALTDANITGILPIAQIPTGTTSSTVALGDHTHSTLAPLASPVFTGDPTAPTPATSDNDTSIATTAFVKAALAASVWTGTQAQYDALGSYTAYIFYAIEG